ncbi:unnamed protein product [Amoebophrya sp. A25]|nr:unnamed protein product [Amoebophrya sp. A25]|eukprot:GSA25T00009218001.1
MSSSSEAEPVARTDEETTGEEGKEGEETKIGIGGQEIPLQSLNPQQLQQLAQQLKVELSQMGNNMKQFQIAGDRFRGSAECLGMLQKQAGGQPANTKKLLVPLNNAVYMDGFVSKPDQVLVDVGTGYYCEKSIQGATDFLNKKVDLVQEQMANINQVVKKKQAVYEEAVTMLMKMQKEMGGGE